MPKWIAESELERTIQQQVQKYPEKTTELWALHFLGILQGKSKGEDTSASTQEQMNTDLSSSPPQIVDQEVSPEQILGAEKHLSAYLQEVCYQSAQKVQKQFQSIRYNYSLADLFQIGNLLVNQPAKLFRGFKTGYQHSSLESYARTAIFRFIGNAIYTQDIEAKREKFSDYGLLRDVSNKELKEALALRGINTSQVDIYCLARHCFNAVCQPQTRQSSQRLEAPSGKALTQIAFCYNQRCNQLGLSALADAEEIQKMLSVCIQAAREYRTRRFTTLENDNVVSDSMPTLWDTAIQAEEKEQVETLISELFTTIPETGQTLLKLWLGLNLTQTEIATVLKNKHPELQKQYQVARQLGKHSRDLLKEFLRLCSHLNPDLSLQDAKTIELIQKLLDDCLQSHCKRLMYTYLEQSTRQYCNEDEFLLLTDLVHKGQLGYEQTSQLTKGNQGFIRALEEQLEEALNLPHESLNPVNQKVLDIVNEWLQ